MHWFVEPEKQDAETNRVCAENLESEEAGLYKAEHGKYIRAWGCTPEQKDWFEHNRQRLGLRFKLWQKGRDGLLRRPRKRSRKRDLRLVPIR